MVLLALLGLAAAAGCGVEAYFRRNVRLDALVYQDSENPGLRFELRPGAEGMKAGAWVKINSDGLREREIPKTKPADEFRVLVVGDEPAFGLGLAEEQTFVRRLESLVKPPAGKRLTLINLSMYHYNLAQEVEALRAKGLAYQPDAVVLESSADQPGLPKVAVPLPRLKNFLRARSVFARWVMERSYWSRPKPRGEFDPAPVDHWLGEASVALAQARLPGLVVLVPDLQWRGPDLGRAAVVRQAYAGASARHGLPFYDGSDALSRAPVEKMLLSPEHSWLGPEGERALASGIAQALQKLITPVKPRKPRPEA